MDEKSLSHTSWNCKYHIVLVPKYRRKVIYGKLRKDIGKNSPFDSRLIALVKSRFIEFEKKNRVACE